MQVAIIPPSEQLDEFAVTTYHLVLAHRVLEDDQYAEFYHARSVSGHFVFLDNSAHELNSGLDASDLVRAAELVRAREVILPDRLGFRLDTLRSSIRAFAKLEDRFPLMVVPQGWSPEEWTQCLDVLLCLSTTVGISKDFESWPGGLERLVFTALDLGARSIHLLGLGRQIGQLKRLAAIPEIRGIDSAKPLVLAAQGIAFPSVESVRETTQIRYPGRSGELKQVDEKFFDIAHHNIRIFRRLARDYA